MTGSEDTAHGVQAVTLEPVDAATVTILVDNVSDMLLEDQGPARRVGDAGRPLPHRPLGLFEEGQTVDELQAEHGFSALVTVTRGQRQHRILFDAGVSPDGLVENMRRLELSPGDIEIIVLSHGHADHTTGMDGLIRALGRTNLPVLIHPEFWSRRRIALPGRDPLELPTTSRRALEGAGFVIVEDRQPSFLLDGSVLITGEVDRTTGFEQGLATHQVYRHHRWRPDPLILDDQALVLSVKGEGLVVLTGCGHAGVINTLRYARKLSRQDRVHAVIGGFHLSGPLFEPSIPAVCDALAAIGPQLLVPTHCTGWRAVHTLAARFPDAFIQTSVGTSFEL
jgi:7,8-dihydropterin-6-yl-methyl-4-(beta-D-ribofuranosyl)aminobenzene 5'-phosphate synthase